MWEGISRHRREYALSKGLPVDTRIPIVVREPIDCSLSFFERSEHIAAIAVKNIQKSDEFKEMKERIVGTQTDMLALFPLLSKHRSGFDWMCALDYFACRRGHNLPILETAKHMEGDVYAQLIDRFSLYFGDDVYRANFMTKLLADLCLVIDAADVPGTPQPFQLHVFSGHDINLLGLLFSLEALCVQRPDVVTTYLDFSAVWPDFATTLALEVDDEGRIGLYMNCDPLLVGLNQRTVQAARSSITIEELRDLAAKLQGILSAVKA